MRYLNLTLSTPAENLALDEALLEEAEQCGRPGEILRLWEPAQPMVIVGRSSRLDDEVRLDVCRRSGVPVLRRSSGGAAIVTGPGCLMYALVLSYQRRPALRLIEQAHQFVMGSMARMLSRLVPQIQPQGISDLAVDGKKVSGNSVRCKRDHLLYHGTLLYRFPLELIEQYLKMPPRQPDYRCGRNHETFVANLPVGGDELRQALVEGWEAEECLQSWPESPTARLVAERSGSKEWNW
jgi:lipoate-protein ligase A